MGKGRGIPCTPTQTHIFAHFCQPATTQATKPKAVLEQKGVGRRSKGKTNESCLLSLESSVMLERGVSLEGKVPGKSWLALRSP